MKRALTAKSVMLMPDHVDQLCSILNLICVTGNLQLAYGNGPVYPYNGSRFKCHVSGILQVKSNSDRRKKKERKCHLRAAKRKKTEIETLV